MNDVLMIPDESRLARLLDQDAAGRLHQMQAEIETRPERIGVLFPAAARTVARGPVDPEDPSGLLGPTVDDLVRISLLRALVRGTEGHPDRMKAEVAALYRYGDADEKRAVLRSLHALPVGAAALPLVEDALRTNDLRLVAAALGPYSAEHLDPSAWRHGVLKCLFVGVPLAAVHGLRRRADEELARMAQGFVDERRAAGRDVPADAWQILDHPALRRQES